MYRTLSLVLALALAGCDNTKTTDTVKDSGTTTGDQDGDADHDGFRSTDNGGEDCDDNDSSVNPGAEEICNSIDDDCDGTIDEDVKQTYYQDFDEDGFGNPDVSSDACSQPVGYVTTATDCDDGDEHRFPGNQEICDGVDNDCDGEIDEGVAYTYYADADGDGYGDPNASTEGCSLPDGYVENASDCDDTSYRSFPDNLEICDEIDNDCDGSVDEGVTNTYYVDRDGDRYGDATMTTEACALPTGYASNADDCNDTSADANPGETEACNGVDDDCDGSVDEAGATGASTYYRDADGDGYGDTSTATTGCSAPSGYVANDDDCDDGRNATNPGASEYCNSIDDDCDGTTDESAVDASTWYLDADGDGYGDATASSVSCTQPSRYVADSSDCDDLERTTYPGADEVCDGEDNDCDGSVDEDGGVSDGETFYEDTDGDGFGDPSTTIVACSAPSGYVDNALDCDVSDATEPVVVDVATGSASGTGTLASPFDTVQDGIDHSYVCVLVYEGTYSEAIDFGGRDIEVTSVEGAELTTIDASGTGQPVVTFDGGEGAASVLSGFTLTGGEGSLSTSTNSYACTSVTTCTDYYSTYCGGGVYVNSADPTLNDLIVRDNELPAASTTTSGNDTYYVYSFGGGLCLNDSAASLTGLDVRENYADQGGGLYLDETSMVTMDQTKLVANTSTDGAGVQVDGGTLYADNVASLWNEATGDGGGLLLLDADFDGSQITWAGDDAGYGGGLYASGTSRATLLNSILYGAGSAAGVLVDATAAFSGTYNNVYGNSGGNYSGIADPTGTSGNISSDPRFLAYTDDGNPYNDDLTLRGSSPSLDAGDPTTFDADGTRADQGAYGGPDGVW